MAGNPNNVPIGEQCPTCGRVRHGPFGWQPKRRHSAEEMCEKWDAFIENQHPSLLLRLTRLSSEADLDHARLIVSERVSGGGTIVVTTEEALRDFVERTLGKAAE